MFLSYRFIPGLEVGPARHTLQPPPPQATQGLSEASPTLNALFPKGEPTEGSAAATRKLDASDVDPARVAIATSSTSTGSTSSGLAAESAPGLRWPTAGATLGACTARGASRCKAEIHLANVPDQTVTTHALPNAPSATSPTVRAASSTAEASLAGAVQETYSRK